MKIDEKLDAVLKKYARLAIRSGVNLQKDQMLIISAKTTSAYFVEYLTKEAFEAGAKDVFVRWQNDNFAKIRYDYAALERFEEVPQWMADQLNGWAREGAAFLNVIDSNPDVFAGIDARKPASMQKAMKKACKEYSDILDEDGCSWSILALPTPIWAKKVFPDLNEEEGVKALLDAILKAVRVDTEDPVAAWEAHKNSFKKRRELLNDMQLRELHITTEKGTDITLGMPENHIWEGGGATNTRSGVYFFPNMPTEEIFATPHRLKASGKAVSAIPLIYQGTVIDGFSITLENGRITDYQAEKGYETLKELVETDDGSHYLGEIALVPNKSPLSDMGILFYDTLFDENAACHIAIGLGFPTCIKDGVSMSKEDRLKAGVNDSATHVDFMIGTKGTEITGIDKNGNYVRIFENGNWAFSI